MDSEIALGLIHLSSQLYFSAKKIRDFSVPFFENS